MVHVIRVHPHNHSKQRVGLVASESDYMLVPFVQNILQSYVMHVSFSYVLKHSFLLTISHVITCNSTGHIT